MLYRTTYVRHNGLGEPTPVQRGHERDTFTPVAKKRKVFHLQSQKREPITISSSPEYDEAEQREDEDYIPHWAPDSPEARPLSDIDLEDEAINSPGQREVTTTSRFKDTTSVPNLTASVARSAFRSISKGENSPQISGGSALPDLFSPSKRNGKHDYITNGNVELVRSWVLDIAAQAQQSQVAQQQHEIVVAEVQPDSSRRFIVALDTDGSKWLVPSQYQQSRTSVQSGLTSIRPGTKLLLKSEATRWTVPIGTPSSEREMTVAAYWEVLP